MQNLTRILLYVWQLPQNLLGLAFKALFYRPWSKNITTVVRNGSVIVSYYSSNRMKGGLSLGKYIFVKSTRSKNMEYVRPSVIQHEYGHVLQSRYLGPFYLIVIGLPSLIHAALHSSICKKGNYYHFFTERWANKLSGLKQ